MGKHSLQTASMVTELRVGERKADLVILNGTANGESDGGGCRVQQPHSGTEDHLDFGTLFEYGTHVEDRFERRG